MKGTQKLFLHVTPIFTPEIGDRMRIVRQRYLWSQAELAERLKISQHQISRLERGLLKTLEDPFSLSHFELVFGSAAAFILLEQNQEKFLSRRDYWTQRHRLATEKKLKKEGEKTGNMKLPEIKVQQK